MLIFYILNHFYIVFRLDWDPLVYKLLSHVCLAITNICHGGREDYIYMGPGVIKDPADRL